MRKISDKTRNLLDEILDSMIQDLDLDQELIEGCFPLKMPYRIQAGEALLTVETRMRSKLKLPQSSTAMDVVSDADRLGVFKRNVIAEEQGIAMLFRGAVLGIRNVLHHSKPEMDKDEALKIILFADYLLNLFENQCKMNKIKIK